MTQEQKQLITKMLQSGIPAVAQEHVAALEEVAQIADMKQEDLKGVELFQVLTQPVFDLTVKVIQVSAPFMAQEYIQAYIQAVDVCQAKFAVNRKEREEREKAEAEKAQAEEKEDKPAPAKKKKPA